VSQPALSLAWRSQTTLVDEIVDEVRARIVRGELEPGLKIRQQEFAEVLGVSRTPLREAFQRLEADGWVQLEARRGAKVRPLTVDEAEEIFTMRVVLETAAARLSAHTHSEQDAQRAGGLIEPGPLASETPLGDLDGANQAFHEIVYGLEAPAMPRELCSVVRSYWTRALRYRLVYWSSPTAVARSRDAHAAIYEAWSARDGDATERAVADHILVALREVAQRIEPARATSGAVRALAERYGVDLSTAPASENR
jgi:DNA-binding GntR family transcriptional regulator